MMTNYTTSDLNLLPKKSRRNMHPADFAGILPTLQFRVNLYHIVPEDILPVGQLFRVSHDFLWKESARQKKI